jgi:hypothetical protein
VAVYSFWVEMRIAGTLVQNVTIPSMNSVEIRCNDLGSPFITNEEYGNLPEIGYLRIQITFGSNSIVIITTQLQQFLHLVE